MQSLAPDLGDRGPPFCIVLVRVVVLAPGQEAPIDDSGELPYTIILDRRGTEVTPIIDTDHGLAATEAPSKPKGRATRAK